MATSRMKSLRRQLVVSTALVGGMVALSPAARAQTLPDDTMVTQQVSVGGSNASIGTSAQTMTIGLNADRTVLTWQGTGFNIGNGYTVNFVDGRAVIVAQNIAVLNRDLSGNPSNVYGSLTSSPNVSVYLLNTNGILFGGGAVVNTGSFLASTRDITSSLTGATTPAGRAAGVAEFLTGATTLRFSDGGGRGIDILAPVGSQTGAKFTTIGTGAGTGGKTGDLVFLGGYVNSPGVPTKVTASGDVAFVAADDVTVTTSGSPLGLTIAKGTAVSGAMKLTGTIQGNNVTIALATRGGVVDTLLKVDGMVTATGAAMGDRGVVLVANTASPGAVTLSGAVDSAGSIDTSGATVTSAAAIDLRAPTDIKTASVTATGQVGGTAGGTMTLGAIKSTNGAIVLNAASLSGTTLTAKTGASVTTTGNITLTGGIDGGTGLAKLSSVAGQITTVDAAGGSVQITTRGNVIVSGNVTASGDATMGDGNYSVTGNTVTLGRVGAATALQQAAGKIDIHATAGVGNGIVTNPGAGAVTLRANSGGLADGGGNYGITLTTDASAIDAPGLNLEGGTARQSAVTLSVAPLTADIRLRDITARTLAGLSGRQASIRLGNVTTTDALSLTTTIGPVTTGNLRSTAGSVTVTADSGDVTLADVTADAGNAALTATAGKLSAGVVKASAAATARGRNGVTLTSLAANGGVGEASSTNGSVTIAGTAFASDTLLLRAQGGDVTAAGATANNRVTVDASANVRVDAITSNTADVVAQAGQAFTGRLLGAPATDGRAAPTYGRTAISAALAPVTGNIGVNAVTLAQLGDLKGGTITVAATAGPVDIDGQVDARGNVSARGTRVALGISDTANTRMAANGSVRIVATAGAITGGSGLTLVANNDDTAAGAEPLTLDATGGNITFKAGSVLLGGATNRSSTVGIRLGTAGSTLTLGDVRARGLRGVDAGYTTFSDLTTGGDITLGNVSVRNRLAITTTGTIRTGNVFVTRAGQGLSLDGGNLILGPTVSSQGNLSLTSGSNLSFGTAVSNGGDASISVSGNATGTTLQAFGSIGEMVGGAEAIDNSYAGTPALYAPDADADPDPVAGGGPFPYDPSPPASPAPGAGDVTISATSIDKNNVTAADNLSLTATGGLLRVRTLARAGGTATLRKQGGTSELIAKQVVGGGDVLIDSTTGARVGDATSQTGNLTVVAPQGVTGLAIATPATDGRIAPNYDRANLTAAAAGKNVTVTATNGLAQLGNGLAGMDLTMRALAADAIALNAGRDLAVTATNGGALLGTGIAGRDLTMAAAGDLTTPGQGNLTLGTGTAGNKATLTKTGVSGELTVVMLNAGQAAGSNGDVAISASTSARLGDIVTATGALNVTAPLAVTGLPLGTPAADGRPAPAYGRANLTALNPNAALLPPYYSVTVTTGGVAQLGAGVAGQNFTVTADTIDAVSFATRVGDVNLTAVNLATIRGGVTAGNDYLVSGRGVNLATFGGVNTQQAAGKVQIRATNGSIVGGGGLTLVSNSGGVADAGRMRSLILSAVGGDIAFDATSYLKAGPIGPNPVNPDPITNGQSFASTIGIDLRTPGKALTLGTVAARDLRAIDPTLTTYSTPLQTAGEIGILTLKTIDSTDIRTSNGSLTIDRALVTAGSLTMAASNFAGGSTLDAAGDLTVSGGSVGIGGGSGANVTVTAGTSAIAGTLNARTGDLRVTAGTLAQIGTGTARNNVMVQGATVTATTLAAANGSLAVTANGNALTVTTASAGTTATIIKNGGNGDLTLSSLTAGTNATLPLVPGDILIRSATNARLGSIESKTGNLAVDSTAATTGLVLGTPVLSGQTDLNYDRANLTALATGKSITVTVGTLAQLGNASAGLNTTVTAAIPGSTLGTVDATSLTATAGALSATAYGRALTLVTGNAGTTATLTKTGAAGDLTVTSLTAGNLTGSNGTIAINSSTNARLGTIESRTGDLGVVSTAATTGLAATASGATDANYGRAVLTALANGRSITVTAGTLAQLGGAGAGLNVTVTAATPGSTVGVIDATSLTATAGALGATAHGGALTLVTGNAGMTATLTKTGAAGDLTVTSLTAGNLTGSNGTIAINSSTNARLGTIESKTGDLGVVSTAATTGLAATASGATDANYGRAVLTALANGRSITVTAGTLAQLGGASAGLNTTVTAGTTALPTGTVDATSLSAGTGALGVTAYGRALTVGTANAGTTATLTKTGTTGELTVTTAMSGTDTQIRSDTAARVGSSSAANGNIDVNAVGAVTGLALGTPGAAGSAFDVNYGRTGLSAAGTGKSITVTAGTLAQLGAGTANGNVTVTASAADAATLTATTGALAVTATGAATPTFAGNGNLRLGAGGGRTTTTLTARGNATLADLGTVYAGGTTPGGLAAANLLTLTASNADIRGSVIGFGVTVTANADVALMRLGTISGATGAGFDLSEVEFNLIDANTLTLRLLPTSPSVAARLQIGALAIDATTGTSRIELLTSGDVTVSGTIAQTGTARALQIGGTGTAAGAAKTLEVQATATGTGGRISIDGDLSLRAGRIAVGQEAQFLEVLRTTAAGDINGKFNSDTGSKLYIPVQAYSSGTARQLIRANSLSVTYTDYALFQNTGLGGQTSGVDLGTTGKTGLTLSLSSAGGTQPNTFAMFGTINGIGGNAAALLGPSVIATGSGATQINLGQSRIDGCLIGSVGGCLQLSSTLPSIGVFDALQANILGAQADLALTFDPLVGSNNETLFADPNSIELFGPDPTECPPNGDKPCPRGTQPQ